MKSGILVVSLLLFFCAAGCVSSEKTACVKEPEIVDTRNLLVNSEFNFHSLLPHRHGKTMSYVADYVPFWNADSAKSLKVYRDSHIAKSIRPKFSVHGGVELLPGQSFHQFFTLPEADLLPGDAVSLSFYGYQTTPGALKGEIKAMKIESADGTWSPNKDFGLRNKRTFNKMARGELVVARAVSITSPIVKKTVEFKAENLVIPVNFTPGKKSFAKDNNTVGIEVRFTNSSKQSVWIFAPSLVRGAKAYKAAVAYRKIPEYYRHIPRTMQKLWKGEPVHIIVMGSSIDRGSANPPLYAYNEDPKSPKFKQPLSDSHHGFSTKLVGRPDLDPYFAWSNHFFSYAGRLKVELMKKFDLTGDKILMNFMATDGSCIGESHSALKQYCELLLPPSGGLNGHKGGNTWKQLYPGLFTRPEGPRPDLVIYGSGANEKTDTPDEAAVFEGAIRYIQRNYPGVEFLGCIYQIRGGYTPNGGDMQAIGMRYGIPFIDFGIISDRLTGIINPHAVGNGDGHPQAAVHYLWFKHLERAFECTGPVVSGFPQIQLPERMMRTTYNWEGRMKHYDEKDKRFFKKTAFVLDDSAFNCWAILAEKPAKNAKIPPGNVFVNGNLLGTARRPTPYNLRNSFFRYGRLSFGDRHVVEIPAQFKFIALDAKLSPGRTYTGVESTAFKGVKKAVPYNSRTGFPYGRFVTVLNPGESCELESVGTGFSVAWVDTPGGGVLTAELNGEKRFDTVTNQPYTFVNKEKMFMENRKGIEGLPYGVHKIRLKASKAPVTLMGVFSYDMRSNRANERIVRDITSGGEYVFEPAFKAVPIIYCSGTAKVKTVSKEKVVFSGSGAFEAIGE